MQYLGRYNNVKNPVLKMKNRWFAIT